MKFNARDLQVSAHITGKGAAILGARPVRSCRNVEYALDRSDFLNINEPSEQEDPLIGEGLLRKRMTSMFLDFVRGTRSTLKIANQYYMPYIGRERRTIEDRREEGKSIQVFANATGDIEVPSRNQAFTCYMQEAAFAHNKGTQKVNLLSSRGGMNSRWELSIPQAQWRIHTKTAIRDGEDVLVSSFNIDPRSYNVNLESGVVVESCPDLAKDLSAQYDQLSNFANADRSCVGCKADLLPQNRSGDDFHCGGTPLFY